MAHMATYTRRRDYLNREEISTREDIEVEIDLTSDLIVEKDYIDICFIDLIDKSIFQSRLGIKGTIDSYIKINSRMSTNTFQSTKDYYSEIYEKMNLIEDSILKIKLKYPHCNIITQVKETYISLQITI